MLRKYGNVNWYFYVLCLQLTRHVKRRCTSLRTCQRLSMGCRRTCEMPSTCLTRLATSGARLTKPEISLIRWRLFFIFFAFLFICVDFLVTKLILWLYVFVHFSLSKKKKKIVFSAFVFVFYCIFGSIRNPTHLDFPNPETSVLGLGLG